MISEEEIKQFVNEMKYKVMFAKCDIAVPYEDMLSEFNEFMKVNTLDFVPFRTNEDNASRYNLDVLSLIDQTDDPQHAGTYIGDLKLLKNPTTQATSIKQYFPKTLKWLAYNIPGIIRCKISRLKANCATDFHHHPHQIPQLDGVLHIPLITNKAVQFYTRDRKNKQNLKSCFFEPKHMWWFNSNETIEHAVTNFSSEDRWHLWINTRIIDSQYNIMGRDTLYQALKNSEKF